jgi:hypothetical protein
MHLCHALPFNLILQTMLSSTRVSQQVGSYNLLQHATKAAQLAHTKCLQAQGVLRRLTAKSC